MITFEESAKKLLLNNVNVIPKDTVICEYTNPGTYTINIPVNGTYEIYCIAPGGESIIVAQDLRATATE